MPRPVRALGRFFVIVVLLVLAWAVGIHEADPPEYAHSLGVVARVDGDAGTPGLSLPIVGVRCAGCRSGTTLVRYGAGAGLRVDMVVSVHPRLFPLPHCGAATVDLIVSATRQFWKQHPGLVGDVTTRIGIGWDADTTVTPPPGVRLAPSQRGSPALVAFVRDFKAPLNPGSYSNRDLQRGDERTVQPFPQRGPALALQTTIANWAAADPGVRRDSLQLHFTANWVRPRGYGSCYVVLPSLLANGSFAGTANAIRALGRSVSSKTFGDAQPPSFGRVALAVQGDILLTDTSPPPTDFETIESGGSGGSRPLGGAASNARVRTGPVWTCEPREDLTYLTTSKLYLKVPGHGSFAGNACGVVAVVEASGAGDVQGVVLITLGVLIAIAFEWFLRVLRPKPEP